jgi:integrase
MQKRIADLLIRYGSEVLPRKKNPISESYYICRLLADPIASMDAETIQRTDFAEFRDRRLLVSGRRSVLYELQLLSHCFTVALSEWRMARTDHPVKGVLKPKQNPPRERRLSEVEWSQLMAEVKASRASYLYPIVLLAIHTTMRKSELVGMRIESIGPKSVLIDGKTGSRHVPLNREAREVLARVLETHWTGKGRLFPITLNQLQLAFKRACERAGIRNFRFHDLRHEGISRYMERHDLTIQEVMAVSGHRNLQTLSRYTHLKVADLADRL